MPQRIAADEYRRRGILRRHNDPGRPARDHFHHAGRAPARHYYQHHAGRPAGHHQHHLEHTLYVHEHGVLDRPAPRHYQLFIFLFRRVRRAARHYPRHYPRRDDRRLRPHDDLRHRYRHLYPHRRRPRGEQWTWGGEYEWRGECRCARSCDDADCACAWGAFVSVSRRRTVGLMLRLWT